MIGRPTARPTSASRWSTRGLILRPAGSQRRRRPRRRRRAHRARRSDRPLDLRETLAFSRADQRDFVVEIDEDDRATVVFGDGRSAPSRRAARTITATYRVGGGQAGNVPAGAIQTIVGRTAARSARRHGHQPRPGAPAGRNAESIEHAVQHAPAVFRSLRRAVTAADYEALARSFKGVGKVRAVATGWNTGDAVRRARTAGQGQRRARGRLRGYFEDKRMLTQIVEIEDVDYVPIYVTAEVGVQSYYVRADVVAAVQRAAAELLRVRPVDFGQTVYLSKFYERSRTCPGVEFVNITEFRRGDAARRRPSTRAA